MHTGQAIHMNSSLEKTTCKATYVGATLEFDGEKNESPIRYPAGRVARLYIFIPTNLKFGIFGRLWNGKFCYISRLGIVFCT
jgi:hypothetical protein